MSVVAGGWSRDFWLRHLVPAGWRLKHSNGGNDGGQIATFCGTEAAEMYETILTVLLHSRIPFLVLDHNAA